MPPGIKQIAPFVAQYMVKKQLHAQGTGRHRRDEVYQIGCKCLSIVSDYLDDKQFLLGDQPTRIDACVFSNIASIVKSPLIRHSTNMPIVLKT